MKFVQHKKIQSYSKEQTIEGNGVYSYFDMGRIVDNSQIQYNIKWSTQKTVLMASRIRLNCLCQLSILNVLFTCKIIGFRFFFWFFVVVWRIYWFFLRISEWITVAIDINETKTREINSNKSFADTGGNGDVAATSNKRGEWTLNNIKTS